MRHSTDKINMENFGATLLKLREKYGYKSARSLYKNFITSKSKPFNYSYYMKIENSEVLPSPKVVDLIASFFSEEDADRLHLAYCKDMFPNKMYLFDDKKSLQVINRESEVNQTSKYSKSELSIQQVALLASKKENYEIFIIASLARRNINIDEITYLYDIRKIKTVLKKLSAHGLIEFIEDSFKSIDINYVFPKAYNSELTAYYKTFDKWDLELPTRLDLEKIINKSLTKRVSLRYLSIFQRHLNVLFEIVRSAEQIDQRHKDRVIQLVVSLNSGKLPG